MTFDITVLSSIFSVLVTSASGNFIIVSDRSTINFLASPATATSFGLVKFLPSIYSSKDLLLPSFGSPPISSAQSSCVRHRSDYYHRSSQRLSIIFRHHPPQPLRLGWFNSCRPSLHRRIFYSHHLALLISSPHHHHYITASRMFLRVMLPLLLVQHISSCYAIIIIIIMWSSPLSHHYH